MRLFRFPLFTLAILFAVHSARAQIGVTISVKEHFYVLHEPVIATVTVTNNTGRDITLSDTPQYQWFAFRIKSSEERVIGPRGGSYKLEPLTLRAGEVVKRSVDLNELYELGDLGIYAIRAEIYLAGMDKFFVSKPTNIELTEGRLIWKKTVGVPEGQPHAGRMRIFSLLAHQRGEGNLLFVRVEDEADGTVYCTIPLSRLLEGAAPSMEFDSSNNLYILQLVGQKAYLLSKISPNGKFLGQTNYSAEKSRPAFRKLATGVLQLVGGKREDRLGESTAAPAKLSDRPPGLPIIPAAN